MANETGGLRLHLLAVGGPSDWATSDGSFCREDDLSANYAPPAGLPSDSLLGTEHPDRSSISGLHLGVDAQAARVAIALDDVYF